MAEARYLPDIPLTAERRALSGTFARESDLFHVAVCLCLGVPSLPSPSLPALRRILDVGKYQLQRTSVSQ